MKLALESTNALCKNEHGHEHGQLLVAQAQTPGLLVFQTQGLLVFQSPGLLVFLSLLLSDDEPFKAFKAFDIRCLSSFPVAHKCPQARRNDMHVLNSSPIWSW